MTSMPYSFYALPVRATNAFLWVRRGLRFTTGCRSGRVARPESSKGVTEVGNRERWHPLRHQGRGWLSRFVARRLYRTNHLTQNFSDYSHSLCPRPSLRSGRATLPQKIRWRLPATQESLLAALARAFYWQDLMDTGRQASVTELAGPRPRNLGFTIRLLIECLILQSPG